MDLMQSNIFQFHIVRLKEGTGLGNKLGIVISIPYSSIKSHRSQPKGSGQELFQFHIVRLKAGVTSNGSRTGLISIPYSSIKRRKAALTGARLIGFQFHIVRLKVSKHCKQV